MIKKTYEKYLLPKLLDCCCSTKPINYQRKKIIPYASGNILEIGIGSGLNLPFYEKSKINNLYGIDPSSELCDMAKKTASDNEIDVNLLINGAEEIELPKDSIDTVVMTYTLCTIPNPMDALKEIKRVTKNRGYLYFTVPFLQGYHADPSDFRRFTSKGFINQMNLKCIDHGISSGPFSVISLQSKTISFCNCEQLFPINSRPLSVS